MQGTGEKDLDALCRMAKNGRWDTAIKVNMLRKKYHDLYALPEEVFRRIFHLALFMEERGIPMGRAAKAHGHGKSRHESTAESTG